MQPLGSGLLIWGAASSVGSAGIQLVKNSRFKVFATASPAHHEYLKSLGVFTIFDYKDPDIVAKIAAAAQSAEVQLPFDTIRSLKAQRANRLLKPSLLRVEKGVDGS